MILRALAVLAGAALLVAAAHVTIEHTGGYAEPHAILTMGIALGVAFSSLCIGVAWSHRQYTIAALLIISVICGEGFGLLATAHRIVDATEQRQAPLRDVVKLRETAEKRVAIARTALGELNDQSPRLVAALAAQKAVASEIADKAALRGCAANCRKLLEQQALTAANDVAAAREAITQKRDVAVANLADAAAALAVLPPPRSATPLADRLGVPAWSLDVLAAVLGSLGANGLGAALIAFGGHAPHRRRVIDVSPIAMPQPQHQPVRDEHRHIAAFAEAQLAPSAHGRLTIDEMFEAYSSHCAGRCVDPLPAQRVGALFGELVQHLGLHVEQVDGEPVIIGLAVKQQKLIAA